MRKRVLFIQGAGKGAYEADKKLAENLSNLLGDGYEVHYPEMTKEDDPTYKEWSKQIGKEISRLGDGVVLVAHSVGASILIKYIMEIPVGTRIRGVLLIATPYWGADGGWTYDGYELLVVPSQDRNKLSHDVPVHFYHSDDDETVPFRHLALYAKRFPYAKICKIHGRGHQLNDNVAEIAKDITDLP